jgi:AraC-like DNA-binding protein
MQNSQVLLRGRQAEGKVAADEAVACANALPPSNKLIEKVDGLCAFDTLSIQMQIHANDTLERKSLSQRFDIPAQLTVMLLLEGDIQASINQTSCRMSAHNGPAGYLWLMTQPGALVRHIKAGQRVRKVNITVPLAGVESIQLPRELREHIGLDTPRASVASWSPTPLALRCAQDILTQRGRPGNSMHSLQSYIAGLSMLQQALRTTSEETRTQTPPVTPQVKDRDMVRASMIRERILMSEEHQNATPQRLAQELGMSVSTLQRLFKAAYGTSVMEFQRTERLNAARALLREGRLTVGEAGYRAGYSTVSNFSSAFQRTFGYPPSACLRR